MTVFGSIDFTVFPPINATLNGMTTVLLIAGVTLVLVIVSFRGKFEKHKRLARYTLPSWLFVSITGVVIYFMVYVWFRPAGSSGEAGTHEKTSSTAVIGKSLQAGDLIFFPASQVLEAEPGELTAEVSFSVKNRGKSPVGIIRLESGCECLSVSIDHDPVPAGGVATITGLFDIKQLRGASEKRISVLVDNQSRPVFLTTRIEIDEIYSIEESMTSWAVGGEAVTKVVEFRVLRNRPIHILSAESKRKEVTCEVETIEEGRSYNLKLTPDSTASSLLGIVRIETDCELESYARPLAYFTIQ